MSQNRLNQLNLQKQKLKQGLPHLYGWPWYTWAKEFFDSTNTVNLLCAANQISKSSTQIRKCIDWATSQDKWQALWGRKPNQFWYLYPSQDVATIEFEKKWLTEFMPNGEFKESQIYGWDAEYDKKKIKAIHFRSGVSVYFKTYSQDAKSLQSGSCYAVFCDEELPVELYDELMFRLAGTQGYFHMVFTATLNQEFWWRALEAKGTDQEVLKDAWKRQVSMYDCLSYVDGEPSPWTKERIKKIEDTCKSQAEVMRRVHGRFIKEEGRKIHAFDPTRHYVKPFEIPKDYLIYAAVDIGSGGSDGHPSAIIFLAVRPDMKKGYFYRGWRGDGVSTTAGDVYEKYKSMLGRFNPIRKWYDFAAKDFGTIANRLGAGFEKANKEHTLGEDILNTLFRNDMLFIFDTDELRKLGIEYLNVQRTTPKNKAKDDFVDASRYCVVEVPWDFVEAMGEQAPQIKEKAHVAPKDPEKYLAWEIEQRREGFYGPKDESESDWEQADYQEIAYWNEEYGH